MPDKTPVSQIRKFISLLIALIFVAGFFYTPIGLFTNAFIALWFVGTQRFWRGALWLLVINFVFDLIFSYARPNWDLAAIGHYALMTALATLLGTLPYLIHRVLSPRLRGFKAALPFALYGAILHDLYHLVLPDELIERLDEGHSGFLTTLEGVFGSIELHFYLFVLVAALLWFWNHGKRMHNTSLGDVATGALVLVSFFLSIAWFIHPVPVGPFTSPEPAFAALYLLAALVLTIRAVFTPANRPKPWAKRKVTSLLLRAPESHELLRLRSKQGREVFESPAGDRFPVKDGILQIVDPKHETGLNRKYNQLYQLIGGFYDDLQRAWFSLRGIDAESYLRGYLGKLEVKSGDRVLETSVGTGLNIPVLPEGVHFVGVDLSQEMLANCQKNLHNWNAEADLLLANAESLPFADASFDVVFHVGGINFFNDRSMAIREMIRVAKPGSLILIADETELHVEEVYEKTPITGRFFKKRTEAVLPPIDLLPPEMEDVQLDTSYANNHLYVLTFRKPKAAQPAR